MDSAFVVTGGRDGQTAVKKKVVCHTNEPFLLNALSRNGEEPPSEKKAGFRICT